MPRYALKRLYLLLLIPAAFVASLVAQGNPALTERLYSQGLYAVLAPALATLTGLFFVSIAELSVWICVLVVLIYTVRTVRAARADKERRMYILYTYTANLLVLIAVLYSGFVFTCGLNYHRLPFAETAGLTVRESSALELAELCRDLADDANELAPMVASTPDGTTTLIAENYDVATAAVFAMKSMSKDYPFMRGLYSVPKPVAFSGLMSLTHISGIYFPYTFEANFNTQLPDFYLPATMCHELAHQRGYMREDEANFIAYLACRSSTNRYFNYSGSLHALSFALNRLQSADIESYRAIYAGLDERIKADFAAYNRFWTANKGPVSAVSASVNNAYLKANSQSDGVQSYGRMVDLLLADYRARQSAS